MSVPPTPMTAPRFTIVKEAPLAPVGTARPCILVAEDDPALRHEVVEQLVDYEVLEAGDGHQALALALRHQPELILLDWMMPGLDGLEVARRLREEASMSLTPILLFTGRNDEDSMQEALEAGVNDFVSKPFSGLELRHRIQNMISLQRAQKEVEKSREHLVKSEKLSSLGELSAGIVHEINNPLNYAVSGVHALKMMGASLEGDFRTEFDEVLGDIREGLTRVSQIATDLRTFAKVGQVEMKRVNLSRIIAMSERFVADRLLNVQYESEVPEDLFILANEGQMSQILINLIVNAVDALHETARGEQAKIIRVTAERTPQGVYLAVWDNGCGIPAEKQSHLFRSFYSTKADKGMGLGLTVSSRMLEAHGAELSVDSIEGQYTRFYCVLPLAEEELQEREVMSALSERVSAELC